LLALASGAAISALVYRDPAWQGRAIAAILAAAWFWVAWAYHLQRYATINWAATAFAAGFGIQAALLIWTGVIRGRIVFRAMAPVLDRAGLGIFVLALVVYPLIGPLLLGREWAQVEVFGIAP
ncbi:MAG: MFS transporter permease, partial [Desulfuromonadales bacterium]|nr:MFS transporter permease [Desulfuromonadales bacterium]NIS41023.1 MFS transporter permease [Desulfuromonadales bacterium]